WPVGQFSQHRGEGSVVATPPPGVPMMTAALDDAEGVPTASGRAVPPALATHLPMAGELTYRFGPDEVEIDTGVFATERTHVTFDGTTAWGGASRLRFHVVSSDWQESDQLLVGIMNDFGAHAGPVPFGGRGEFDGVMTGAFRRPRVEGDFSGEELRAWDTAWGRASSHAVIENDYVTVSNGLVRAGDSEIHADGTFSLRYPRDDGGDESDARFRVVRRELDGLRHAFKIDDYPVSGKMSGEFHLTGEYEHPIGFGGMTIEPGTAYGEPFEKATASLR